MSDAVPLLLVSITPLEPDRAVLGLQEVNSDNVKYFVVDHEQLLTVNGRSADILLKRDDRQ